MQEGGVWTIASKVHALLWRRVCSVEEGISFSWSRAVSVGR